MALAADAVSPRLAHQVPKDSPDNPETMVSPVAPDSLAPTPRPRHRRPTKPSLARPASRLRTVNLEHPDPLAHLDSLVNPDKLEAAVVATVDVLLLPNPSATQAWAVAAWAVMASRKFKAHHHPRPDPAVAFAKDPLAHLAHQDPTDNPETVEPQDPMDSPDRSPTDPQLLAHQAQWDHLDPQEAMDSPEDLESPDAPDLRDNPERVAQQDPQETPVPREDLDSPEELVARELATTARPHAPPPAIKRDARNKEQRNININENIWRQIYERKRTKSEIDLFTKFNGIHLEVFFILYMFVFNFLHIQASAKK